MNTEVIARNSLDGKCLFYGMSNISSNNLQSGNSFEIKISDTSDSYAIDKNNILDVVLIEEENNKNGFVGYVQTNIPQCEIVRSGLEGFVVGTIVSDINTIKIPKSQ